MYRVGFVCADVPQNVLCDCNVEAKAHWVVVFTKLSSIAPRLLDLTTVLAEGARADGSRWGLPPALPPTLLV
jgi:hypothetical protein